MTSIAFQVTRGISVSEDILFFLLFWGAEKIGFKTSVGGFFINDEDFTY